MQLVLRILKNCMFYDHTSTKIFSYTVDIPTNKPMHQCADWASICLRVNMRQWTCASLWNLFAISSYSSAVDMDLSNALSRILCRWSAFIFIVFIIEANVSRAWRMGLAALLFFDAWKLWMAALWRSFQNRMVAISCLIYGTRRSALDVSRAFSWCCRRAT